MMNVQELLRVSVEETVSEVTGQCRVAVVKDLDPEKMARAPSFAVWCRTEELADMAGEHLGTCRRWRTQRTGPNDLTVDTNPYYKPTSNGNYSSVWDD